MLMQYKRKANIAAGIWLVSLVPFVIVLSTAKGNIWETGNVLGITVAVTNVAAFWYAFWSFAKAKGYSGALGVVLPLFSVLGLIVLISLRDKHKETETLKAF
ncbi:MAG TPA: hypothetical protein VEN78_08235 [Bradyrhizobium sp.]|nr:hypothetical protein [Bradyrhizobium sp.]